MKIRVLSHYALVLLGRSHHKFTQHCCTQQQVVNIAEGGLFKTHTIENGFVPSGDKWVPGLKAARHSPTYVLWGNTSGTHPQNPRVLKAYKTYVDHMCASFQIKVHGWFPVWTLWQALVLLSNTLIHLFHPGRFAHKCSSCICATFPVMQLPVQGAIADSKTFCLWQTLMQLFGMMDKANKTLGRESFGRVSTSDTSWKMYLLCGIW